VGRGGTAIPLIFGRIQSGVYTIQCARNLAGVWRNWGLLDEEAEELLKEMLEICARAYGYDNP